jgi:hypothetical protein
MDERTVQAEPRECAPSQNCDEPDPGDRGGEADAEGQDENEAESDPVESDRREEHDERRRTRQEAGGDPDPEESAAVVAVVVVMLVVVLVVAVVRVRVLCAAPEDGRADRDHEEARHDREPRVEALGNDEAREEQGHQAEGEDSDRVGDGDDETEQHRMPRAAPRADEVAGDNRLPMPGRERVRRAPERGDDERDEDDAGAQLLRRDESFEPPRLPLWRRTAEEPRRDAGRRGRLVGDCR